MTAAVTLSYLYMKMRVMPSLLQRAIETVRLPDMCMCPKHHGCHLGSVNRIGKALCASV